VSKKLSFWIGMTSLPLIAFAATLPAAAADRFTCRASALRLNLPLSAVQEPVVANPADDPCTTDAQRTSSYSHNLGISSGSLAAKTDGAPQPVFARAKADGLKLANVLDLVSVRARHVKAEAHVTTSASGKCRLKSSSVLEGATAQGQSFSSLTDPTDYDVKLLGVVVGKLHLNATLGGTNPTIGDPDPTTITQRAIWFHVTDPVLAESLSDLIVGEASVGVVGDPCT
jgi:hypothetical protein